MAILYHPYTDPSRVYYGTDTRVAALLLGAALAFVWAPWRLVGRTGRNAAMLLDVVARGRAASSCCWMFLNVGEFDPSLYRGGFLLVAMVSAVLIAATVHPASRLVPWLLGVRRCSAGSACARTASTSGTGRSTWSRARTPTSRSPASRCSCSGSRSRSWRRRCRTASSRSRSATARSSGGGRGSAPRPAETRRKLATRFGLAASGHHRSGLVVIVVGLGDGGSAAAPAGLGRQDLGGHPARADHHDAPRPPVATTPTTVPATTAPPVTTLPPTTVHRHRRLGDARRRQPAGGHRSTPCSATSRSPASTPPRAGSSRPAST